MDPATALIFSLIIATVFTKNIFQDSVFKATGKMPPSYLRQQERMRLAAEAFKSVRSGRKPARPQSGFRGFFRNAYNDAWETADEIRQHRRGKRVEARRQKWSGQIPDVPGETPEPIKPKPDPDSDVRDFTPDLGDKEETAYRRYAIRRRNGGQPMNALAVADELGVPVGEGQRLLHEWESRIEKDATAPAEARKRMAEASDAAAEASARGDLDTSTKHMREAKQAAAELGITTSSEMAKAIGAYKNGIPLQKQEPAPGQTGATPTNRMEHTVNSETTGLQAGIAYTDDMAKQCQEAAASTETSVAAFTQAEVGPAVTGPMTQAQDLLAQVAALYQQANAELQKQIGIADGYAANPDAGNKQFQTQG